MVVVVATVAPTGVTSSALKLRFHRLTPSRIGHVSESLSNQLSETGGASKARGRRYATLRLAERPANGQLQAAPRPCPLLLERQVASGTLWPWISPSLARCRGMTESDQSHESWEQRVTHMAETTDQWSIRTNDAPPIVAGSALGGDDRPGLHVSGIAWYAIVVAVEHLEFTFSAIRATGTLYPTAQITALRTALLTGSQTSGS